MSFSKCPNPLCPDNRHNLVKPQGNAFQRAVSTTTWIHCIISTGFPGFRNMVGIPRSNYCEGIHGAIAA